MDDLSTAVKKIGKRMTWEDFRTTYSDMIDERTQKDIDNDGVNIGENWEGYRENAIDNILNESNITIIE